MANDYKVTKQVERIALEPDGSPVDVMEVTFEVASNGTVATVKVPLLGYTAAAVAAAIEPVVAEIEAVTAL